MRSKSEILDRLIRIIRKNKSKSPDLSYTSKLFKKGKVKIANKVGEEATETITAFLSQDREDIAEEAADLIFHLYVLLEHSNVSPEEVFDVLSKRMVDGKNN
ncbi:phosphoribosyl-ATP diphosphatase [Rickettsiales bacterium]|nr:phosphoribosyl-ATP diphosphatase [Rickettsiales bacterium]